MGNGDLPADFFDHDFAVPAYTVEAMDGGDERYAQSFIGMPRQPCRHAAADVDDRGSEMRDQRSEGANAARKGQWILGADVEDDVPSAILFDPFRQRSAGGYNR